MLRQWFQSSHAELGEQDIRSRVPFVVGLSGNPEGQEQR